MKKSCCLWIWFLIAPLWGQDQTPAPASAPSDPSAGTAQDSGQSNQPKPTPGTSKDRLFFTLPNFLTLENAADAPPLTTGQKFAVTARGSFDPVELAWYGALAGIGQAENSDPTFGQGVDGYAKRYAENFADGTIENFMTRAVLPSVLHQDPRYFQLGKGGFWHRVGYAVGHIFITRSDAGATQFNFSEIVGSASAAGISTFTYHPHDERNLGNAVKVWGTQVGFDTLSNVVKEFWPDIRRKLRHGKAAQS
ncbi:MAG: hypothetical protein ABSH50_23485 [Bryobacteraceae bacterium]|jgi:hypothetical protein